MRAQVVESMHCCRWRAVASFVLCARAWRAEAAWPIEQVSLNRPPWAKHSVSRTRKHEMKTRWRLGLRSKKKETKSCARISTLSISFRECKYNRPPTFPLACRRMCIRFIKTTFSIHPSSDKLANVHVLLLLLLLPLPSFTLYKVSRSKASVIIVFLGSSSSSFDGSSIAACLARKRIQHAYAHTDQLRFSQQREKPTLSSLRYRVYHTHIQKRQVERQVPCIAHSV